MRDKMKWTFFAKTAIAACGIHDLLHAATSFISEAEEMGWGKTSETALPGSYDTLKMALDKVRGNSQ